MGHERLFSGDSTTAGINRVAQGRGSRAERQQDRAAESGVSTSTSSGASAGSRALGRPGGPEQSLRRVRRGGPKDRGPAWEPQLPGDWLG